jgi:hypothetical protein
MSIQEFSLDPTRLENVKHLDDGGIRAACPACRAAASDKSGDHLLIKQGGKFGCATHPNDPEHRKEIYRLAGTATANGSAKRNRQRREVAWYDYHDENGTLLYQVVRLDPKDFRQRRPDHQGGWVWNTKGVAKVLFRLPKIITAKKAGLPIYVTEGERDTLEMVDHGFAATTPPGGANKEKPGSNWLSSYTETLRDAEVVIVADKDETGRKHAAAVAEKLTSIARLVKIVECPDRDGKAVKDAADFFAAGGTADELRSLVEREPEFIPATKQQSAKPDSAASEYPGGNDEPESDEQDNQNPKKNSAATRLVKLADEFTFIHDQQSRPFVRLDINGHREVWPVNSIQFRNLLARTFYTRTRTAINRNALSDAIATLAGRACFDGPEEPACLRVASNGQNILIDLGDPQWRVVEVTPTGWRVLGQSPIAFFRTAAMRSFPNPAPASEGSLAPLWDLLNVLPAQRPLVAGALLVAFHPDGPYFVTNFIGEQGSAKSCGAKILRMLVDPNEVPLRSPPRDERDLLVHAGNNRTVVLDNLSSLPAWLSDALCRLATGGGHSARQLYSDGEEFTLSVKRPVILTGIDDVAARPDLAERALQIELEEIHDNRRITETELWRRFEAAWPVIFSGVLNGLVCALREQPKLKMESLPRMADAAKWVTAGEIAFGWPRGTFMAAYSLNLSEGAIASLDTHPVGVAIRDWLDGGHDWKGEPAQLLTVLNTSASTELRGSEKWPKDARALSACLRRLAQRMRLGGHV